MWSKDEVAQMMRENGISPVESSEAFASVPFCPCLFCQLWMKILQDQPPIG